MGTNISDHVRAFWGGGVIGRCYQLTDERGRFIQLTAAEARAVASVILDAEQRAAIEAALAATARARDSR